MRHRTVASVCLALVLGGLSATLYKFHFPPGPVADEAGYVMITQSLLHDHDLRYERKDLDRAYRIWDQGPYGMVLLTLDGGETMFYGKPFIYSLAAVPFYALFGVQGFLILNMLLYLGMLGLAAWVLRRGPGGGLFLGGFFFASVTFNYVFWAQPEIFNMFCLFVPYAIWWPLRRRADTGRRELALLALAGALLGAAVVSKEPMGLLALPLGLDLVWRRRWKGLAVVVGASLVVLLGVMWVQWRGTGTWSPYRGAQRRSFEIEYPFEADIDFWKLYKGTTFGSWSGLPVETNPRVLARNLEYFFLGRHTGVLPYFPFALFAVGLYLASPKDRLRTLLLLAVVGYCALFFFIRSHNYHGGAGFLGNRYFASVYPLLLFLPGRLRAGRGIVLPYAAAGLWTASVVVLVVQPIAPEFGLQVHTRSPTFQALPLELTLVGGANLAGYARRGDWTPGVWVVPRQNFFTGERHPHGVWVRGASRSEVFLVSPEPLSHLRFTAFSPLPGNVLTVESGAQRVEVDFSQEANRQGAPVEIELELAARDLDFFEAYPRDYFYRLVITTTEGWMPSRRDPGSRDPRYLSTFLSFTGEWP